MFARIHINNLKPAEYNPRMISDEDYEKLKKSIKEFGLVDPIIVNLKNNTIIGGHQRYKVLLDENITDLKLLRMGDIGYVFQEKDLQIESDIHEKGLNLALNNINGEFVEEKLQPLLEEVNLSNLDIEVTGFDKLDLDDFKTPDIETESKEITEDNYEDPIAEIETNIEYGDLYQLGNHYLICGDATNKENLDILLNAGDITEVDLVFTDPPYGMKKEKEGIQNDNLNYDKLLEFNKKWIPLSFQKLNKTGSWYCWGIDEPLMDIYSHILKPMIQNSEITFRNLITWSKHSAIGVNSPELRKYPVESEKCLFIMKGVQGFNSNVDHFYEGWTPILNYLKDSKKAMGWNKKQLREITGNTVAERHYFQKSQFDFPTKENYLKLQKAAEKQNKNNNAFKKDYDAFKKDYNVLKKEWQSTRAYFNNTHNTKDIMTDVWRINTTSQKERENVGGHVTPKPIKLCSRAILSSSRENENVLDLFGGSGSTLIACEQLNRNCYMMEIEPKYCQTIINRWEDFTGQKAQKIN